MIQMQWPPFASSSSTTREPMKPVPPATRMFTSPPARRCLGLYRLETDHLRKWVARAAAVIAGRGWASPGALADPHPGADQPAEVGHAAELQDLTGRCGEP